MRLALVVAVAALVAAGCGADKKPVAHVGDITVTHGDFKAFLDPEPKCSDPSVNCRYQHLRAVQAAMGAGIHYAWARQEAKLEGIEITDADRKRISLGSDPKPPAWFRDAAATDVKLRSRMQVKTTATQLRAFRQRLLNVHAQRRDALVVVTRSKSAIDAAVRSILQGVPIEAVARRYALDWQTVIGSPATVGRLVDVTSKPAADPHGVVVDPDLRAALFKAQVNQLVGPVRGRTGWYVFLITGQRGPLSAAQRNGELKGASQVITDDLKSERLEEVLEQHWLAKTRCEDGYVVAGRVLLLGGFERSYYSTAGCGNYVPFKTPAPR